MAGPKTILTSGSDENITGSTISMLDAIMRVESMKIETCIPAVIMEYDRKTHLAIVKPLVNMLSSDGEELERDSIEVPVRRIQHGAFIADFPIYRGDTGWLIASDRNTELAILENLGETTKNGTANGMTARPQTRHIHKYRFGFFIPDRWGNVDLADDYGASEDDAVICSRNGKTKILISQEGDVEITLNGQGANSNLTINSNVTICGNATFKPSEDSTDSVVIDGGGITASKAISSVEDMVAQGISLANHYHKDSWGQDTTMPTS